MPDLDPGILLLEGADTPSNTACGRGTVRPGTLCGKGPARGGRPPDLVDHPDVLELGRGAVSPEALCGKVPDWGGRPPALVDHHLDVIELGLDLRSHGSQAAAAISAAQREEEGEDLRLGSRGTGSWCSIRGWRGKQGTGVNVDLLPKCEKHQQQQNQCLKLKN